MDQDRGGVEQPIELGFGALDFADVFERQFVGRAAGELDEAEIGEHVPLSWWAERTAAPQLAFPGERYFHAASGLVEVHFRDLRGFGRDFEERVVLEPEDAGRHVRRELAPRRVVFL